MSSDPQKLIELCLDGMATDLQKKELAELLRLDESLRRHYVDNCHLREVLHEYCQEEADVQKQSVLVKHATYLPRAGLFRNSSTSWAIGSLATAAALLIAFQLPLSSEPTDDENNTVTQASETLPEDVSLDNLEEAENTETSVVGWTKIDEPALLTEALNIKPVATIIQQIDCVFADGSIRDFLQSGQKIDLKQGFVKLAYENGVEAVIEGPAEYTVVDELTATLGHGRLGVRVPDGFSGFVVDTPSARVVDLGTEFSMRVRNTGVTQVHVVEGEVEVAQRDEFGNVNDEKTELLKKHNTWNSIAGIIQVPKGAPRKIDFTNLELLEDPAFKARPKLSVREGLSVWMAADRSVKLDHKRRVVAWGDISSDNPKERHSSWQVEPPRRPTLVNKAFGNKPAIRFDGRDDCLVTEPFQSSNNQTIAIVCKLRSLGGRGSSEYPGMQLLNYNGPPHLVLEFRLPEAVLCGRAHDFRKGTTIVSGWNTARPIRQNNTIASIYTYDYDNFESSIYLNGVKTSVAPAGIPIENDQPKVIGLHRRLDSRGFVGLIGELLIYDRALSEDEVLLVNDYFSRRYGTLYSVNESN